MDGRPPRPPSESRRGGAKSPPLPGNSPEARTEYEPAAAGSVLRKRSPSPTPHKRSSSLSRTGRDPLINQAGNTRLRSASPSSRPGTQQRGTDADHAGASSGTLPLVGLAARGAESSMRRGSEVLLALERLSGSESPGQVVMGVHETQPVRSSPVMPGGKPLGSMCAAGISSRLRLAQQTSTSSAGLQTVGSLTVGSLGVSPVDGRQAGRGIALRVGHVNTSPACGTKLRVGGAPGGPKIAPSTLVAKRLFGELKEQAGSSQQLPKPEGQSGSGAAATRHGRTSPRTTVWASEIRAASIRFDQGDVDPEQRTGSAGTNGPQPHLPAAQDPWVALERLRLKPESPEFVYMIPYRRSEGLPLNPYHVKVVPHAKTANKQHFTLSLGGVTKTRPGEEPEFTPLEVWKRECYIFESLIEIPVFSRYKWWKNFKVWKENVRYSKFVKNRESFQRQSVLMNPIMYMTLLRLRDQAQLLNRTLYNMKYKACA